MRKKSFRRVLSLFLCAALFLSGAGASLWTYAYGDYDEEWETEEDVDEPGGGVYTASSGNNSSEISRLQNQIDRINDDLKDIQSQQKQLEQELGKAQTDKERATKERNHYSYQIQLTQQQIATLQQRIEAYEQQIALLEQDILEKQGEIDEKQREYNAQYSLFKTRVRSKYMQNNGTMLGLILGADSFSDFLARSENMARIGRYDKRLMADLTEERQAIEAEKAGLEEDKKGVETLQAAVQTDKKDQESAKAALDTEYRKAAQHVLSIELMEQEYLANLEENKRLQDAKKKEIDDLFKKLEYVKSPYVGGQMLWPLPGYTTISSNFGPRFNGSDYHTGVDITGSGCNGTPIVAANDGKVSFVNTSHTPGVGYGIYVIIDHGVGDNGQNISTLYAHCSEITVSQGQLVKRGDTVAKVGSTGWSTGPHVHFEVRIGSSAVNPLPYLQG